MDPAVRRSQEILHSNAPHKYIAEDADVRSGKGIPLARSDRRLTVRGAFHGLIALSGWILFFYWWRRVVPQITQTDATAALLFIAATFLVTLAVTLWWVSYNIRIFRRKGPRTRLPDVLEDRDADVLGRAIDGPGDRSLRQAQVIVIAVDGERKSVRPGGIA